MMMMDEDMLMDGSEDLMMLSSSTIMERILATTGKVTVDYSILAVMVGTLALVLIVELIRHFIDHFAESRPFFQAVLNSAYSELSTLGIVEAVVYILLSYYHGLDLESKKVFEYCHFLLFFTALFNALQTVFQATAVKTCSNRLWVRSEELELFHYVAIREEFETLHEQLKLEEMNGSGGMLSKLWIRMFQAIRNPGKLSRYRMLLVQVRFHELRLHFLQANDLPMKLKVSKYLKASETHVLKRLVSVSALAWILFTSVVNLTYFVLGMVVYVSDDATRAMTNSVAYLFIGLSVGSVLVALVLYLKLRKISLQILKMKFLDCAATTERIGTAQFENKKQQQLKLFWFGDPKLVMGIIQFLQFGYAVAGASLLIFWDKIQSYNVLAATTYLGVLIACYVVFVIIIGQTIPRYTICTSMGALTDRQRLKDQVSKHKLNDAILHASDNIYAAAPEKSVSDISDLVLQRTDTLRDLAGKTKDDSQLNTGAHRYLAARDADRKSYRKKAFSDSGSVAMMRHYGTQNSSNTSLSTLPMVVERVPSNLENPAPVVSFAGKWDDDQIEIESIHSKDLDVTLSTTNRNSPANSDAVDECEKTPEIEVSLINRILNWVDLGSYRFLSEVFGTLICFFLVSMRVEVLLLGSGAIKDYGTTFHLSAPASFWMEVFWLSSMIISAFLILAASFPSRAHISVEALLDLMICSVCFVLLFIAEAQRCCSTGADCCGPFGARGDGGLGKIEPFTSLIVLRSLRFLVSRFLSQRFGLHDKYQAGQELKIEKPKHDKKMTHMKGTILELWEHALAAYPEIAREEGQFSSGLLMAMLGIPHALHAKVPMTISEMTEPPSRNKKSLRRMDTTDEEEFLDDKLILPMRRCDWMLPPVLATWRAVDVVATPHCIFVVKADDWEALGGVDKKQLERTMQRIRETDGGVGMRARDVILGRKILSHIDMDSVDSLVIDRHPPRPGSHTVDTHYTTPLRTDFWFGDSDVQMVAKERCSRWRQISEDHLKVVTGQTTNWIRFYGDLETKTCSPEAAITTLHTFTWCKAIVRMRGPQHLAMKLPHFGEDNEAELLDYLHEHHHEFHMMDHVHIMDRFQHRRHANRGSKSPKKKASLERTTTV